MKSKEKKRRIYLVPKDGKDCIFVNGQLLHALERIHSFKVFCGNKKIAVVYTQSCKVKFMVIDLEADDEIFIKLVPQPTSPSKVCIKLRTRGQKAFIHYKVRSRQYFLSLDGLGPFDDKLSDKILEALT